MQPHVANYFAKFGYTEADKPLCELCHAPGNSVHHVIPRSHFGSRQREQRDDWTNLICLCGKHHDQAHNGPNVAEFNERIRQFVKERNEK